MALEEHDIENVRIAREDAVPFIQKRIAADSLAGVRIYFADPWPKKRHHKRRIINKDNLDIFAHILKPGGKLVMSSDVELLAEWMCTQASNHLEFEWSAQRFPAE